MYDYLKKYLFSFQALLVSRNLNPAELEDSNDGVERLFGKLKSGS